jgi:hypothetical protein
MILFEYGELILLDSLKSKAETYPNIICRMCEVKRGDDESKEATFEEYLKCSPICNILGELYSENGKEPEIYYKHEISKLKRQKQILLEPLTENSSNF